MFAPKHRSVTLLSLIIFLYFIVLLRVTQNDLLQAIIITKWSQAKVIPSPSPTTVFNVDDFGGKADGTDDSEAFEKAWKTACSSRQENIVLVPKNRNYYLKPIQFSGPCKSPITVKMYGTIKASLDPLDYRKNGRYWIFFKKVDNLMLDGGGYGTFNGNGKMWWQNSCKVNNTLVCSRAPNAVTFQKCKNLSVINLRFRNAQNMHVKIRKCVGVQVFNLRVNAPENSPNTDGIHITMTQDVQIDKCVIETGDDCISIVNHSKNVTATDITCGPGHGISIGSLGARNSEEQVSDIVVNRVKLVGTTNGVRIKTWQGGSGYAKNITFQNIIMRNVSHPIIIDQNYCDQKEPCSGQASAVKISNVVYRNIKGTSASEVGLRFECSKQFPCEDILLENVNLLSEAKGSLRTLKASCQNVRLINNNKTVIRSTVSPMCSSEEFHVRDNSFF